MKHALLYGSALLRLMLRPRRHIAGTPRTIVILQSMKMGDMVCTTPLFAALKKHMPHAQVAVMGDARLEGLLKGNPHVDRYIPYQEADLKSAKAALKRLNADVAITPGPNPVGLALLACAGIPFIIVPRVEGGRSPYETLPYRVLRRFVAVVPHWMDRYAPGEYLSLLHPLGIHETDTSKCLAYSDAAGARAESLLPEGLLVGIAPSAGNKVKQWPAQKFAALADRLISEEGAIPVLFGSEGDAPEVAAMLESMQNPSTAVTLAGLLSHEELKAAIARLNLFIASDTGSIYIAEAFDVPTVDIVGPVDERVQPPRGERHRVVVPPGPRVPQISIMNSRVYDEREVQRQAEAASVEDVYTAAHQLLAARK